MVSEGYIIFYVKEMIIHGYHNQPFCKRQKAILQRYLMFFFDGFKGYVLSKKQVAILQRINVFKGFQHFSRHIPFCRCIGCGCHGLLKIIQNRDLPPDPTFPAMKAFTCVVLLAHSVLATRDDTTNDMKRDELEGEYPTELENL